MGLSPANIYYAIAKDKIDLANEYNASDCTECGACSFECPAKLDLTGMIKYAKLVNLRQNGK
jgi:Na+-translocating ferredoxin:NAD+ oxidoreductase subunit C